ncbi:MAG: Gfo/Idh/MocA family oxidoreductase [Verrucomicrobiota bacterium]
MRLLLAFAMLASVLSAADLRVGLVGLDTSHVIAFTNALNDPANKDHVPGAKVTAIFKGGSPDVKNSATRVDGYTADLSKRPGITLYESIAELAKNVDAIMIESVDGRPHLPQFKEVLQAGKPVFIDKPLGGSLRDALEIVALAKAHNIPLFSSSSLRFNAVAALKGVKYGELRGAFTFGPCELEEHHPDLYWYGIHAVETLYTVMGKGCKTVVRTQAPNAEIVTGVWEDGRVGTMRGNRNTKTSYGLTVFGSTANVSPELKTGYGALLKEIVTFFQTKVSPVPLEDTIEIMAFMEAADESKRRGGAPVVLADVIKAASKK